jgi:hypothetical protein
MDGWMDRFLGSAAGVETRVRIFSLVCLHPGGRLLFPGLMWQQPASLVGLWGRGRGRQTRTIASLARPVLTRVLAT